jgi:AraC-like DNA-binding protein
MEYREYRPSAALAACVHCIWTLQADTASIGSDDQPILPDGKSELIVHLADPFDRVHAGGASERQPAILFAGQLTSQLVLRPTGRIAVVGIRFRPDGAAAFLSESQDRFAGLTPAVSDVAPALAGALESARSASDDPARVVAHLQAALERMVQRVSDLRVRYAVDRIGRARGMLSISDLAAAVGMTPRHLERRFMHIVGMSPKRLARIARFQHALAMLDQLDTAPGTRTAAACGFADQAHFVRDFRDLAGVSPGEHMLQRAEFTGFFTERVNSTRANNATMWSLPGARDPYAPSVSASPLDSPARVQQR